MKVLRRLLRFAAPYWKRYLLSFCLVFGISALNLLQPMVIKWVIDGILETNRYHLLAYGALQYSALPLSRAYCSSFSGSACLMQGKK